MAKGPEKDSSLEKSLYFENESVWKGLTPAARKKVFAFADDYKGFISRAKTERRATQYLREMAEEEGFKPLEEVKRPRPGDRLYAVNREKNIALVTVGKEPVESGLNIIASHIDSPRLDLKQRPLYEDRETELAMFKTHYYGGLKKYQWANVPLAVHGVVVKEDGQAVDVCIGEDPKDPVLVITDLLPHLSRKVQGKRKLDEGLKGEELNILGGSIPSGDKKAKKKVKLGIMALLNEKYKIREEDLVSAELEAVPAGPARDVGLDGSMVGAYGHDDRACAYTSARAACDAKAPRKTSLVLCFDKEEIGSEGDTSVKSTFFELVVSELIEKTSPGSGYSAVKRALANSSAISADGNGAVNPTFKDVHEMGNAARMGFGVCVTKFTGSGGKYSSNDASAEYTGKLRRLMNKNGIKWQAAELGKVDEGGGGTVAKFLAQHNMQVIDAGPAGLSMHAPFEVLSKVDLYECYRLYKAFIES